jgi:hypothetical protein
LCWFSVVKTSDLRPLHAQERLRQQIEEIKEQEAAYDPNAALAMAMFEHSEVGTQPTYRHNE